MELKMYPFLQSINPSMGLFQLKSLKLGNWQRALLLIACSDINSIVQLYKYLQLFRVAQLCRV